MKWIWNNKPISLEEWKSEAITDPERLGKTFILNISYSGAALSPMLLAEYIEKVYGKQSIKKIEFRDASIALLTLENPFMLDTLVGKFRSCIFRHITSDAANEQKTSLVRFDVCTIFPLLGIVELQVENAMRLKEIANPQLDVFNVLVKLLYIVHPSLGPHVLHVNWPGKESHDESVRILFVVSDILQCREKFAQKNLTLSLFGTEYRLVYVRSVTLGTTAKTLTHDEIDGFSSMGW